LRATTSSLSVSQWLLFDEEAVRGGVDESCLFAMRLVSCSSLPLELPLLWARFRPEEALSAVSSLLSEVCFFSQFVLLFFIVFSHYFCLKKLINGNSLASDDIPLSNLAGKFSGPLPCHAAACALRTGVEGTYLLARSLLVAL
jgi:hypothetical protein